MSSSVSEKYSGVLIIGLRVFPSAFILKLAHFEHLYISQPIQDQCRICLLYMFSMNSFIYQDHFLSQVM
jgi:hypothetical protein